MKKFLASVLVLTSLSCFGVIGSCTSANEPMCYTNSSDICGLNDINNYSVLDAKNAVVSPSKENILENILKDCFDKLKNELLKHGFDSISDEILDKLLKCGFFDVKSDKTSLRFKPKLNLELDGFDFKTSIFPPLASVESPHS